MMDSPFFCLGLDMPASVKAISSDFNKISYPLWSIIAYQFPAAAGRPAVRLVWYDGGKKPPRPRELEKSRAFGKNGVLYIGDKGKMLGGGGSFCQIIPEKKRLAFGKPPKTLPRPAGHYSDWINACKGARKDGKPIAGGSNFSYSGPMTESIMLGNVALHYPGEELKWDSKKMTFTNKPQADALLADEYREGWKMV
jgi:hypothetical protein